MALSHPLKLKDSDGSLQRLDTSEKNYIAYLVGEHLKDQTIGDIKLGTPANSNTIGSFVDTYYNEVDGTHPASQITSTQVTTYLSQDNQTATETGSDWTLPVGFEDSNNTIHEMNNTNFTSLVDEINGIIVKNEYPSSFRLADSPPSADWSVHIDSAWDDTINTGDTVNTYKIYKRTNMTSPDQIKDDVGGISNPICIKRDDSDNYQGLTTMTDDQISYTLGQRAATRRGHLGAVGNYQLRSGTQGAPTDTGTWEARGTATNTQKVVSAVDYVGNYARDFIGDYTRGFIGDYVGDYSRNFAGNYTGNYTRGFAGDYARNFVGDYNRIIVDSYSRNFLGNYTGAYSRNFIGDYNRTFVGNYARGFVGNYVGNFIGNYTRTRYSAYTRTRNSAYSAYYTRNFTRSRTSTYTRNFSRSFAGNYLGNYTRISTRSRVSSYTRGPFTRTRYSAYVRNRSSSYSQFYYRVGYLAPYVRTSIGVPYGQQVAFTGTYGSNYYVGTTVGLWSRVRFRGANTNGGPELDWYDPYRQIGTYYIKAVYDWQSYRYVWVYIVINGAIKFSGPYYPSDYTSLSNPSSFWAGGSGGIWTYPEGNTEGGNGLGEEFFWYSVSGNRPYQAYDIDYGDLSKISESFDEVDFTSNYPAYQSFSTDGAYDRVDTYPVLYSKPFLWPHQYTVSDPDLSSTYVGQYQYYTGNYNGFTRQGILYYYTGQYTGTYSGATAYYTGNYVGNYVGVGTGTYQGLYVGDYVGAGGTYTRIFAGNYTGNYNSYARDSIINSTRILNYLGNYTRYRADAVYTPGILGANANLVFATTYLQVYTSPGFTGDYTRIVTAPTQFYTGNYSGNYVGNFLGNFTRTDSFVGNFIGDYTATSLVRQYFTNINFVGNYSGYLRTRTSTVNGSIDIFYVGASYTRDSTRTSAGVYTAVYHGNYAGEYTRIMTDALPYASTRNPTVEYVGNYTRIAPGSYNRNYVGNYSRDFSGIYTGTLYTLTFTRTSQRSYVGNYTGIGEGTFVGYYVNGSGNTFVGNYTGIGEVGFTGTYTDINYPQYIGNYVGGGIGTDNELHAGTSAMFTGDFTRISTVLTQQTYLGNYSRTFAGNYSRGFTGNYVANYSRAFAGNYLGNYTRTSTRSRTSAYAGDYTRSFAGNYTADYLGNYSRGFTGNYARGFVGDYTRTSTADFTRTRNSSYSRSRNSAYSRTRSSAYSGAYTRTRNSSYTRNRSSAYSRTRSSTYTRNRVSTYTRTSTRTRSSAYSDNYTRNRVSTYNRTRNSSYLGNYLGDTIQSSTETAETYTLYVRVA